MEAFRINHILNFLSRSGIEYQYHGSLDFSIEGFCPLSEPRNHCITWIKKIETYDFSCINKDFELLFVCNFFNQESVLENKNIIQCGNPKEVFFDILKQFFVIPSKVEIQRDSVIETKNIGGLVSIGHNCYIGKNVVMGNNVTIHHNVVIECPAIIGDNTIIWSRVIIGSDGYGYYEKADCVNYKVPHFGGVRIGRNVEIGANTCIDRGTLGDTVIGNNVKIDNLCQIGHNVQVEDNVLIIAGSILCGSSIVRENAYIAPGAIVMNQKTVGQNSTVGLGSAALNDVPADTVFLGVPARLLWDKDKHGKK